MTIKKRIFFSNLRLLLFSLAAFVLTPLIIRTVLFAVTGTDWIGQAEEERERLMEQKYQGQDWGGIIVLLFFTFFVILIGIINSLLTFRLTKTIVKPLESLSEGVRQIQRHNLSFRIDYKNDDEFRPVCEAFNEMTGKLEESAERQRKDEANRRELIAGISHDLRTPLTSIKGYLEGLESGVASTPEMREKYFNTIKNKTVDLEHIIEQLFLFSKLDMDEFPLNLRLIDISLILFDMIEELAREYGIRGLDVRLAPIPGPLFVSADTLWLRNVIINILENSAGYKTKERGAVEISVSVVNNAVLLRFVDDGPGVSVEALPKLFDAFYRSDPSRNKKGSGLGLAISAKIIERFGGNIHGELPAAGGLAIVICLPLAEGPVLT